MSGWFARYRERRRKRRPRRWTKLLGFLTLLLMISWIFLSLWAWPRVPDWLGARLGQLAHGRITIEKLSLGRSGIVLKDLSFQANGGDGLPHLRVDADAIEVAINWKWGEKPGLDWVQSVMITGGRLEADLTRESWQEWLNGFSKEDRGKDNDSPIDWSALALPQIGLGLLRVGVRTQAGRWELLQTRLDMEPEDSPGAFHIQWSSDGLFLPRAVPVAGNLLEENRIEFSFRMSDHELALEDLGVYVRNLPRLVQTKLVFHRESRQMLADGILTSELGFGYASWWVSMDGTELESASVKVSRMHPLDWVSLLKPSQRAALDRWIEDDGLWSGSLSILGSRRGNYSVSGSLQGIGMYPRDRPILDIDLGLDGRWFDRYLELDLRGVFQGNEPGDMVRAEGTFDWAVGMESPRWTYQVAGDLRRCMDWAGPEVTRFPWQADFLTVKGRGSSGVSEGPVFFDGDIAASDAAWTGIWVGPVAGHLQVRPGMVLWDPASMFNPDAAMAELHPLQAGGCIEWGSERPWHLSLQANTGLGRLSIQEVLDRLPRPIALPPDLEGSEIMVSGGGYLDWIGGQSPWVRMDTQVEAKGNFGRWTSCNAFIEGQGSLDGPWDLDGMHVFVSGGEGPSLDLSAAGAGRLNGLQEGAGNLRQFSLNVGGWPWRLREPASFDWSPGRFALPGASFTEGLGGNIWFAGEWFGQDGWDVQGFLDSVRLEHHLPPVLRTHELDPLVANAEFSFSNTGDGINGDFTGLLEGMLPVESCFFPGQDRSFRFETDLASENGAITIPEIKLTTALGEIDGWVEFPLDEDSFGNTARTVRGRFDSTPIELKGLDRKLVPDLRIYEGQAQLAGLIEGSLDDLYYSLSANIQDGLLRMGGDLPPWEHLQVGIQLEPGVVSLNNASISCGGGSATISGGGRLSGEGLQDLDVEMDMDHFLLMRKPDIRVRASGLARLRGDKSGYTLGGDLQIVDGAYTQNVPIPRLHQLIQRRTSSVEVFQAPIRPISLPRVSADSFLSRINLDLGLKSDRFRVRNNVLSTWLDIFLHVNGDLSAPLLLGQISSLEGNLFLPLTRMLIDQLYVRFSAETPNVPILDFVGKGSYGGYTVELEARGPASRPEIRLSSDPALPTQDVLWLLTTGKLRDQTATARVEEGESFSTRTSAGFIIGRSAFQELVKDYGGDMGDWLTRLEIVTRPNDSLPGQEIIDAEYRLNQGFSLIGGRDKYGDYNGGLLWRLKIP